MNLPSRFEISDEQRAINAAGIARCRAVIEPLLTARIQPEPEQPMTRSEEIHQRARERAIAERRNQRLIGIEPVGEIFNRVPVRPAKTLMGASQ